MKEILKNKRTGAECIRVKHKSGLSIYVCEMLGFSSIEALFGAKYGSVNTQFKIASDKDYITVPMGIAHFLEHKLFENEECGVFELYARTGASANAYTSFDKTCYMFNCAKKNYEKNLHILLDFVQNPYFDQDSIYKERGIIGQEIQMTNDNPEWRVLFNMLGAMYHAHPVKIDIAGTVDSLAQIDANLLYKCYNAFYNLNNMTLSIAGNISADKVIEICDEMLRTCDDNGLESVFPDEMETIVEAEVYEKKHIGKSIFYYGCKCIPCDGIERLKKTIYASITGSILTDASTKMYNNLINNGFINSSFGSEVFNGDGFFTIIFSGESSNPKTVKKAINDEIKRIIYEGIDEKMFQRIKCSTYGCFIRELNNVEAVASLMINSSMSKIYPYDAIDVLSQLTSNDVLSFMENELIEDKFVLSVVGRTDD